MGSSEEGHFWTMIMDVKTYNERLVTILGFNRSGTISMFSRHCMSGLGFVVSMKKFPTSRFTESHTVFIDISRAIDSIERAES